MDGKIEAVIFDADGTILDTREVISRAAHHVLTSHGYSVPNRAEASKYGGKTAKEYYARFAPNHDSEEMAVKHRDFQLDNLQLIRAYEGFEGLMSALKAANLKIGICTSRRKNVLILLEHLDVKHFFDAIMHADLVTNYKPHPEGLLKLCEELQVEPSHAVMVGDTFADVGAGKAAGVRMTIGITHGEGPRDTLVEAGADHIVDHLNDILPLVT